MRSKFEDTDEYYRKQAARIKRAAAALRGGQDVDRIESLDNPETPDEELERLAWELNVAENNYWQAVAKYRDITKPRNIRKEKFEALLDSGVNAVDQTPGQELDFYINKHGQ